MITSFLKSSTVFLPSITGNYIFYFKNDIPHYIDLWNNIDNFRNCINNNNNNGEHLYCAFPHRSKRLTLIITPIDQVSIWNHVNFLGSIQSGCLLGAQRLASDNIVHYLISGTLLLQCRQERFWRVWTRELSHGKRVVSSLRLRIPYDL